MLKSKREAELAFGRQCYTTLMEFLSHRITREEFEERMERLEAKRVPRPVQTTMREVIDEGKD